MWVFCFGRVLLGCYILIVKFTSIISNIKYLIKQSAHGVHRAHRIIDKNSTNPIICIDVQSGEKTAIRILGHQAPHHKMSHQVQEDQG